MKKVFLFFLIVFSNIEAQQSLHQQAIVKCTIAASAPVPEDHSLYIRKQCAGQLSAIGSYTSGAHKVSQGFIQNLTQFKPSKHHNANHLKFSLYPNPFADFIDLSFTEYNNQELHLEIYSLRGVKKYSKTFKGSQDVRINLQDLPPDTYIVRILTSENIYTKTIIKFNSN